MPQPEGADLDRIHERRDHLRAQYLADPAPPSTALGVHHVALICRDVEETIGFYQGLLGFPLVEMVESSRRARNRLPRPGSRRRGQPLPA